MLRTQSQSPSARTLQYDEPRSRSARVSGSLPAGGLEHKEQEARKRSVSGLCSSGYCARRAHSCLQQFTTMTDQEFAVICYNILMSGGPKGTTMDKSVDYMFEKLALLGHGYDAFAALDIVNQRRVIFYLGMWGFDIPPQIRQHMEAEEEAARQLRTIIGRDIFENRFENRFENHGD